MLDADYRELTRLIKLPRRMPTQTTLYARELGIKDEVDIVDACTYLAGYQEIFIDKLYQFQSRSSTPVIIDCGANIGLSTLFFKKNYPSSRIIAFEADPLIYKTLCNNLNKTNFQNIDVRNEAVWSSNSEIKFTQEGGFSGRISKPGDEYYTFAQAISVKSIRLKDVIARENQVDFLKLDIEGAETEVILDCTDALPNVDFLFIEYHSHQEEPQTLHTILEVLEAQGFRYHIREAYSVAHPFLDLGQTTMLGMDLQVNIFAYSRNKMKCS